MGEGQSKEAVKLFRAVELVRDMRAAMREHDWIQVKEVMEQVIKLQAGIHHAASKEIALAQVRTGCNN